MIARAALALLVAGCASSPKVVVLIPGVGTDGRVFDRTGASLVDGLRRAGHQVVVLDDHRDVPADLRAVAASHPGAPLYAVGLDLGGTAAYLAAPEVGALRGGVGIGAPVAFGGATDAMRYVFARAPPTWADAPPRVREVLLGAGWSAETTLPRVPLDVGRWARLDGGRPVPEPYALEALNARPDLRVLVLTAPADGVAPPWACDPAGFGLLRENVARVWVTRANDFSMEYRHLDLLLHPRAPGEIHPLIEDWLDAQPQ